MNQADVIIVGAGISGLLCATELKAAGFSSILLDKGRGFGGRMATRRIEGGRFDHGAQYFTARDSRFQGYVKRWLDEGIIREWFRHASIDSNPSGYPRYCGVSGMTDVPKFLARDLDVRRSSRVDEVAFVNGRWVVTTEAGLVVSAESLVMTAPLPQSLNLMDTSGLNYAGEYLEALRAISYEKGLATLVTVKGETQLPEGGFLFCDESPLSWIADNLDKGISEELRTITLHADAEFAAVHWDSPDEIRGKLMLQAAARWIGEDISEFRCHRWGFTTPINPWHEKTFCNSELNLVFGGDALGGARIEGAALSGIECAQAVLQNCGSSLRGS